MSFLHLQQKHLASGSGVPTGGGGNHTAPPPNPKFWKCWAEFPVPWKIQPLQLNKNTGFAHMQIDRNPWLGGCCPQIPVLSALCTQPNLLNLPPKKFLGTPLAPRLVTHRPFGAAIVCWHQWAQQWLSTLPVVDTIKSGVRRATALLRRIRKRILPNYS
jgi:hypothetical protein